MIYKKIFTKKEQKSILQDLSTHKERVIISRTNSIRLLNQYKKVIKEQHKMINDLMDNLPKMIYVKLVKKFFPKWGDRIWK